MSRNQLKPLTERQEIALMKYCDGECGFFHRLVVKQLLNRSESARSFCESLRDVRCSVRQHDSACLEDRYSKGAGGGATDGAESLWGQIEQRLIQEERAELFLGARRELRDRSSRLSNWMWGYSGAVTAAALILIAVQVTNRGNSLDMVQRDSLAVRDQSGSVFQNAQNQISGVQPVSASNLNDVPRPLRSDRGGLELEWVRSDGHVRFLSDSQRTRSFIWVQRRSPLDLSAPTGRRLRPFAQSTASARANVAQGAGDSEIVELQHIAPRTLSVSNK